MVLIIPHSDENANLSLMVSQHKIAYKTSKEAVRRSILSLKAHTH